MTTKSTSNLLTTVLLGLFTLAHRADGDFLNTASQANLAEIAAGRLAGKMADRPAVRAFADSMVADHQIAERELEQIAHGENVVLANSPDTEHQRSVARLANLSGSQFDSAYMHMQLLDHQAVIQLFQQESGLGRDSLARMYAKKYLPRLRHHLEMAKKLTTENGNVE
jgi:putative membrane protein